MMDYIRDPSVIYEKSFAIIRDDLSGLPVSAEAIAIRHPRLRDDRH
jgi:hypothetical protein